MHERFKFLLWRVAWNIVPTWACLALQLQVNFSGDISCPFCNIEEESLHHLLLSCSYSRMLWRLALWPLAVDSFQSGCLLQWISCIIDPSKLSGLPCTEHHWFQLFVTILIDYLWIARNCLIHDSIRIAPAQLLKQIFICFCEHVASWKDLPRLR